MSGQPPPSYSYSSAPPPASSGGYSSYGTAPGVPSGGQPSAPPPASYGQYGAYGSSSYAPPPSAPPPASTYGGTYGGTYGNTPSSYGSAAYGSSAPPPRPVSGAYGVGGGAASMGMGVVGGDSTPSTGSGRMLPNMGIRADFKGQTTMTEKKMRPAIFSIVFFAVGFNFLLQGLVNSALPPTLGLVFLLIGLSCFIGGLSMFFLMKQVVTLFDDQQRVVIIETKPLFCACGRGEMKEFLYSRIKGFRCDFDFSMRVNGQPYGKVYMETDDGDQIVKSALFSTAKAWGDELQEFWSNRDN